MQRHSQRWTPALVGLLIMLGWLAQARLSTAMTLYVATTGNDAVTCSVAQNMATPKRTISAGVACLTAGDTLYIRAGEYVEDQITIGVNCTAAQPCTIMGYPGGPRPVIRPLATANLPSSAVMTVLTNPWSDSHVTLKNFDIDAINTPNNVQCLSVHMRYVTVENLYCVNAARNGLYLGGLTSFSNSDYIVVRNNHIKNCGRIQPPEEIFDTKGNGIYSVSGNALIEGNLIDGCRGGGLEINYDANLYSVFRNNIIRNCGTSSPWGGLVGGQETTPRGIVVGGKGIYGPNGPMHNLIYNNIIENITGSAGYGRCIAPAGGSFNILVNNTCYNADTPYIINCGTENTNMTIQNNIFAQTPIAPYVCGTLEGTISHNLTNPDLTSTFLDVASRDFRLKTGSAAIDAGVPFPAITQDYAGVSRPQGSAYDIGAYEYTAGDPTAVIPPPQNLRRTIN